MPHTVAAVLYGAVILALFALDRDRSTRVSAALWIPVIWTSVGASRAISQWLGGFSTLEWKAFNIGVATDKIGLGAVGLVFGLASVWRVFEETRAGRPQHMGPVIAHAVLVAMTLYVFQLANSATSFVCFLLGTFL